LSNSRILRRIVEGMHNPMLLEWNQNWNWLKFTTGARLELAGVAIGIGLEPARKSG